RRLAQQFPADAEARMTSDERRTLHALAQEHAAALSKDLRKITNTVNPIFTAVGGHIGASDPSVAATGQTASEELYTIGRKSETLLAIVLGVSPAAAPEDATSQS